MKALVVGATGLVGSAIISSLKLTGAEVFAAGHKEIELTDPKSFVKALEFNPDVIFNAAVFQGVEPCEQDPEKAFMVNVHSTRVLAQYCGENNKTFVYISTEAVFDESNQPRLEDEQPNPMNYYGLTKYNGEIMTRTFCDNHYIFRLPVMFGTRENSGANFLEKMHSLYSNGIKTIKVVDDIISRPTYSSDAADIILSTISQKEPSGIYHVFNSGDPVSSYDFVKEFFHRLDIHDIEVGRAKAADFSINETGKKPLKTILGTTKHCAMRDWKEAMADYTNKIKERGYV